VRIVADVPDGALTVRGLESRIAQVVSNIVLNGISFSPEGGTLRVAAWRDDLKAAVITVEDDGPGIPADNLDSIFERFYTERPEGEAFGRHSGLGLSISRRIVEAHGGTIRAENREGGGARFIVRLPS
jgi:two-component system sensor histidine kinase ChvG